jgi:protein-disulfide isomerase
MRKIWVVPAILVVIIVIGGAWWMTQKPPAPGPSATPATTAAAPSPAATPAVSGPGPALTADDRILGKPDAAVTIIEYASLTCPHCAAFERETLPQVEKNWIETGKAKLVYRDYPLDALALKASVLTRCAPPERYFGFVKVLFESQTSWARAGDVDAALLRIAKLGGMTDEQFQACMKNDTLQNKILGERLIGEKDLKVDSTPTFFVNGRKLVGEQPYETFNQALKDAEQKS